MYKTIIVAGVLLMLLSGCADKKQADDAIVLKTKADSIIAKTFDTLRSTLMQEIADKGFAGAVDFCNTHASGLTNTYSGKDVLIKRTSDRIRNPANTPDERELEILALFGKQKRDSGTIKPLLEKDQSGIYHYYKPILLQSMCLNCHGDKETKIQKETWDIIGKKYPADSAFNYREGELRGIWHLTFLKKQ